MATSTTRQWMAGHPDDTPCPSDPIAALAWRRKRELDAADTAMREKYKAAMAEKAKQEATS